MADGEEAEKELTAKQRKSKKKKEAAKRKKQEEKQKDAEKVVDKTTNGIEVEGGQESSMTPEEKFHLELDWCIEQLELGLTFQKPDKKQADNTQRHLKSLKSPKTAMPRKRQLMFSLFGDYRKKMEEDKKKNKEEPSSNLKLSAVKQEQHKSVFVNVCHTKSTTSTAEGGTEQQKDGWKFEGSDNGFRFQFDYTET